MKKEQTIHKEGTLKNCFFILKEMWKIDKLYMIICFFVTIMGAIIPVMSAYFLKEIVNIIMGSKNYSEILNIGILFAGIFIPLGIIIQLLQRKFIDIRAERIKDKIKWMFSLKTKEIDMSAYDDHEYYDSMVKAINDADNRYFSVVNSFYSYISSLITVVGLFTIVISIDYYMIIAILIYVAMVLLIADKSKKVDYAQAMEIVPSRRFLNFLTYIYRTPQFIQEEKIYNTSKIIKHKYNETASLKNKIISKKNTSAFFLSSARQALDVLLDCFIILYLGYRVYLGVITMGDFTAMMSTLKNFGMMIANLCMFIPTLKNHNRYICNIKEYLEYEATIENRKGKNSINHINRITIKNIHFSYPNKNNMVLKNVNFEVQNGEKVAIVGHNGAGKTTLIKLLLRLYDPVSGEIYINDKDLKEYNVTEYRSLCSVIFQDYRILPFSIKENITYDYNVDIAEKELNRMMDSVDLIRKIDNLPKKYDTILSREYDKDGIEISVGEKQKIAIARALYRNSDLIILDEASSALDPMSEVKLNKMFLDLFSDKIVFIISHRLSTTKNCDKIIVLNNGEITEMGNHKELMELNGLYFEMFTKQASQYIEE